MKRKIGLFAALAMGVTFSGVYATWTYAESDITATGAQTAELAMGEVEVVAKGALTIEGKNTLKFVIDDTNNDHIAEIVPEGSVTVKYTPSTAAHAPQTVTMTCTITVGGEWFTVDSTTITKGDVAEWTINASDLRVAFKSDKDITWETKADFDQFAENLANNTISLVISAS